MGSLIKNKFSVLKRYRVDLWGIFIQKSLEKLIKNKLIRNTQYKATRLYRFLYEQNILMYERFPSFDYKFALNLFDYFKRKTLAQEFYIARQKIKRFYGNQTNKVFLTNIKKHYSRRAYVRANFIFRQLESKIYVILFRLGIAPTINAARRIITKGFCFVNGNPVYSSTFSLKNGDFLTFDKKNVFS